MQKVDPGEPTVKGGTVRVESSVLIDKREMERKRNAAGEARMVLWFYEVDVLWDKEFPGTGI